MGTKKLLTPEDSIHSNHHRKLDMLKYLLQWKNLSILLFTCCFILLLASELGYFDNEDILHFEGKISDKSLIKTFKEKLKSAVDASQNFLESGYKKLIENNENSNNRFKRSLYRKKYPFLNNINHKNNFNTIKPIKGIYKVDKSNNLIDKLLSKQIRIKRNIYDDNDNIDQSEYNEFMKTRREKRMIESELENLQFDYVRCKKNAEGDCNIIYKKIIKLIKEIRLKLIVMTKLVKNNRKYLKDLSLSTDEILFDLTKEELRDNGKKILNTKIPGIDIRRIATHETISTPSPPTPSTTTMTTVAAANTSTSVFTNGGQINDKLPENYRQVIEGLVEGKSTNLSYEKIKTTTLEPIEANKKNLRVSSDNLDDAFVKQSHDLGSPSLSSQDKYFYSDKSKQVMNADLLESTKSNQLLELTSSTTFSPRIKNEFSSYHDQQLLRMEKDRTLSNIDDGLLVDYHDTERNINNFGYSDNSAPFLNLCEQIMKNNGFKILKPNSHQSFNNGFTNSPNLNQVTNRGSGFPVTAETMKASAHVLYNPNFGIPFYPICFFASPTNIGIPNNQLWSSNMQLNGNNFPGILNGFNGLNGGGGKFNAIFSDKKWENIRIVFPINEEMTNVHGIDPRTEVNSNLGFIYIPPVFGNIQQQGVSVGPFTHTSIGNDFGRSTQQSKEFVQNSQPYFCTYAQNDPKTTPNSNNRSHSNATGASQKSIKLNIPSSSDIIYATYVNRMAVHFDNVLKPLDCTPGFVQCASPNAQCIPVHKWCDSQVDCIDASDETACSCKARLPELKICDGYADCPLGEDEWGCYGCHSTQFSCYNSEEEFKAAGNSTVSMCYNRMEKCDGFENCLNGRDEEECSMIVKALGNHQSYSTSYTEGYLHRNYRGKWYPVCGDHVEWAKQACGTETDDFDTNPEISAKNGMIPGPFISVKSRYSEPILSEACIRKKYKSNENVVIYVKCPKMKCGRIKKQRMKIQSKRSTSILNEMERILRFKRSDDRVVGGIQSKPMEWPFIVALYRNGIFHCGGVIYNEFWIITAAHCVLDFDQYYFEVRAGLLRRSSYGPMIQNIVVENIIPHEFYERENMKNDLALVRLREPLLYNRWVRPICLPEIGRSSLSENWIWGPEEGTVCTAVGWGAVREKGPASDNLLQVNIPILEKCKTRYDQEAEDICAGEANGGRDACQGDSGGPLFCKSVSDYEEWYLAGVVSHGEGCARPGEPGVYTRIALYKDWINSVTSTKHFTLSRPVLTCPGFMCVWGGTKCVEASKRCNKIIDCLGGEDEVGCTYNHVLFLRNNQNDFTKVIEESKSTTPINMKDFYDSSKHIDGDVMNDVEIITTESTFTNKESKNSHEALIKSSTITDTIGVPTTTTTTTTERTTTTIKLHKTLWKSEPVVHKLNDEKRDKFLCTRLPQKVDKSNQCDKHIDCEDGTDEENCTCRDYLKGTLSILICDGKVDCNDSTDEIDCGNCTENQFFCSLSQKCIDKMKVCDGKSDCDFKEDENDCYALTNGQVITFEANNRPIFKTKGILTENQNGIWKIVCARKIDYDSNTNNKSMKIAEDFCSLLGFKGVLFHNKTLPLIKSIIPPITEELLTNQQLRQSTFSKNLLSNFDFSQFDDFQKYYEMNLKNLKIRTHIDDGTNTNNTTTTTAIGYFKEKIEIDNECEGVYLECNPRSNIEEPYKISHKNEKFIKLSEFKPSFNSTNKPNIFVRPQHQLMDFVNNKTTKFNEKEKISILSTNEKQTIVENLHWPWLVQVYADGEFKCIGVLVDKNWIIVEDKCLKDIRLNINYIAVLLGGNSTNHMTGKHSQEQIRQVDCLNQIPGSNVVLLHLKNHIHFTRYVLPTYLPENSNDTRYHYNNSKCLVVHYNLKKGIESFPVEVVLNENSPGRNLTFRFKIIKHKNGNKATASLDFTVFQRHAIIICKDTDIPGWYPQSLFSYDDNDNSCMNSSSFCCISNANSSSTSNSSGGGSSIKDIKNISSSDPMEKSFTIPTSLEKSFKQIQEIIDRNKCDHIYQSLESICETSRCPLGNCLLNESICNGIEDCHDGRDEKFCHVHKTECKKHEFKCNNGKCVSKSLFCNHHNDCEDFSDEPMVCSCFTYLQATDPSKICDGIRNCWDKSDESYVICKCTEDKFRCGNTSYCVPKDFVCDKFPDCPNGEDEHFCYGIEYPLILRGDSSDGYGQVIEQSYGIWHTKCFPRHIEQQNETVIIAEICTKLGYDNNSKPSYRLIEDNESRTINVDTDAKNDTTSINKKYQTSTKAVVVNKFSPLRLNKDFTLFIKPSRPIAELIVWNENDYLNCNRLEIKCN